MARKVDKLLESVSKEITPTDEEAKLDREFATKFSRDLLKTLNEPGAEACFVGSAARDTGLRGDRDIDLFLKFPRKHSEDYIVKKTFAAARKTVDANWVTHYAEHPYLKAVVEGFEVEVIPCFQLEAHGELKSAVDRTPLHMTYLQERLTKAQRRDVRLLKKILKTAGIYGAEISVQGFSGLLCEYLILNYRSLLKLVEEAGKWKPQVFVDLEGFYASTKPEFDAPLVLIDAIDKKRNVAAVVSEENFAKFIALCQEFKRAPSREFFFAPKSSKPIRKRIVSRIKARGTALILLTFEKPEVIEDILVPQIRKTAGSLVKRMQMAGFQIVDHSHYCADRCGIIIELAYLNRPALRAVQGPFVWDEASCRRFAKAHEKPLRGPFLRGSRVFVEEAVKKTDALDYLAGLLAKPGSFAAGSRLTKPLNNALLLAGKDCANVSDSELPALWSYLGRKQEWWRT